MTTKKQPNPMTSLQAAHDALAARIPHVAHLGGTQQHQVYEFLQRAKVLLNPEEPLALAASMNEMADVIDGCVAQRDRATEKRDAERREQVAAVENVRAETAKRREEARLERIRIGATPLA